MRRIIILLFILVFIFSVSAFAGQYELVKGKGVEVCEAYGKNLNYLKTPLFLKAPQRKINPEFKDFNKPQWEKMYFHTEGAEKLFPKIDRFLWERDANPINYIVVTEWKNWRGTPRQYAQAWKQYKKVRQAILSVGLPITKVDIDNDGKTENICLDSTDESILLVLNEAKTDIDLKKTSQLLQHPGLKAQGKGELTADGKRVKDAMHALSYDVFIYKQKTYFDLFVNLWEEGKEMGPDSIWGGCGYLLWRIKEHRSYVHINLNWNNNQLNLY